MTSLPPTSVRLTTDFGAFSLGGEGSKVAGGAKSGAWSATNGMRPSELGAGRDVCASGLAAA